MKRENKAEVEIQLSRDLGFFDITMIGVGAMIGAGIFVLIGSAARVSGSLAIIALFLNGLVTSVTALSYAELASAYPSAGSVYIWSREALPPPFAFASGWMNWMANIIACSLYAVGFASFITFILGPGLVGILPEGTKFLFEKLIAVLIVCFFTFINYSGVETTGRTENYITLSKIIVLGVFVVAGIVYMIREPSLVDKFLDGFFGRDTSVIFLSMGLTFVAFEGYEIIAQSAEEVRNPRKNIPKAIFTSITIVVILYLLVFFVVYNFLKDADLNANPELAVILAGGRLLGPVGLVMMLAGGLLATTSALNATIYSSSRMSFAMGRDRTIPSIFGRVHKKKKTPYNAVLMSGGIVSLMAVLLPIESIAASAAIMFLILFIIANLCVISLRAKRPDLKRGFRVPLVPIIPIIGIVCNLFLAVDMWFFPARAGALYGPGQVAWYIALLWIFLGLIIHYPTGGKKEIEEITPAERKEIIEVLSQGTVKIDRKKYRIMVPVADLDDIELVRLASSIAKERGGDLTILNVLEVPKTLPLKSISFHYVDEVIRKMGRLERSAKKKGIETHAVLRLSHRVYETILEVIREEDVNLLVLGWKGVPSPHARILGSNIDYLVQKAPCDVVVFKSRGLVKEVRSILILSGYEWHATYATELAAILAKESRAKVSVLTIVTDKSKERQAREYSNRLLAICEEKGVSYEHRLVHSPEIIETALKEATKHDLLVMGASLYWPLQKYAFGPQRDSIAGRAEVPVLMLRKVWRR